MRLRKGYGEMPRSDGGPLLHGGNPRRGLANDRLGAVQLVDCESDRRCRSGHEYQHAFSDHATIVHRIRCTVCDFGKFFAEGSGKIRSSPSEDLIRLR